MMMFSGNNQSKSTTSSVNQATQGKNSKKVTNLAKYFTKRTNLLGLWVFLLVNIGALGLVFVIQLVSLVYTGRIANKPEAVLVEKADGRAFLVEAIPSDQRSPKAIQRFTSDILSAIFTITPISPQQGEKIGELDPGIKVAQVAGSGNDRVSTNAYVAVLAAVSPDFRDAFLAKLAAITPTGAFNGQTQVLFKVDFLGKPLPVEGKPGEWTITVVGARYILVGDSLRSAKTVLTNLESQPFRQVVYLQSVTPQFDPLPQISTDLQKSIFRITQIGLQITKMVPLDASTPRGGDFLELPN